MISEPEHNWANAYATSFYSSSEENKAQRKPYDIGSLSMVLQYDRKEELLQSDLEGPAFNLEGPPGSAVMASLTSGLGGRNSISTNTVSPLIVKLSDLRCEFSV
ncbi:hypothetical protein Tco_0145016 [Tanacetum coccineum]